MWDKLQGSIACSVRQGTRGSSRFGKQLEHGGALIGERMAALVGGLVMFTGEHGAAIRPRGVRKTPPAECATASSALHRWWGGCSLSDSCASSARSFGVQLFDVCWSERGSAGGAGPSTGTLGG